MQILKNSKKFEKRHNLKQKKEKKLANKIYSPSTSTKTSVSNEPKNPGGDISMRKQ